MRARELERLLLEWQAALGLLDWTIELRVEPRERMPGDLGAIEYDVTERDATIFIRAREEHQERTLVHELLHLWFRTWGESRKNGLVEEQAIEAISRALLGLKESASRTRKRRAA